MSEFKGSHKGVRATKRLVKRATKRATKIAKASGRTTVRTVKGTPRFAVQVAKATGRVAKKAVKKAWRSGKPYRQAGANIVASTAMVPVNLVKRVARAVWTLLTAVGMALAAVGIAALDLVAIALALVLCVVALGFEILTAALRVVRFAGRCVRTVAVWAVALRIVFKSRKVEDASKEEGTVVPVKAEFVQEEAAHTVFYNDDIEVEVTVTETQDAKEAVEVSLLRSEVCAKNQAESEKTGNKNEISYWFGCHEAALAKEMGEDRNKAWALVWKSVNNQPWCNAKMVREGWNEEWAIPADSMVV